MSDDKLPKLPFGYRVIAVKNFDALLSALDRAERKGYMPDAISAEWEAFEYSQVPAQENNSGDCAVCVLGISGDCYCKKSAPAKSQTHQHTAKQDPLVDEQIIREGLLATPISSLRNIGDTFKSGVRFAEAYHGITKPDK